MAIITSINAYGLTQDGAGEYVTAEGLRMNRKVIEQMLTAYGIPTSVLKLDDKFQTFLTMQLIQTIQEMKTMQGVVENDKLVAIVDPKSQYVTDADFDILMDKVAQTTNIVPETSGDASLRAVYEIPQIEDDNYLGDLFKRRIQMERRADGGVSISVDLLRLACTNGMQLSDKQFNMTVRTAALADAALVNFAADAYALNLQSYLNDLWYKNGEPLQASVSDYLKMRHTLNTLGDDDTLGDIFLPTQPIENHYMAQGIDINTINDNLRNRMPAGITYYQAFNFLTNGAKHAPRTLENQIKVGNYIKPSRMSQLKASDITFSGAPTFAPELILKLQGDTPFEETAPVAQIAAPLDAPIAF